jgi:capsular polysaccharide biosynthesis protein
MMDNFNKENLDYLDRETVEFDKVLRSISKNKIFLIVISVLVSASFYMYSFYVTDNYKSEALLKTTDDISGKNASSNYGALASLAGLSFKNGETSDKSVLALEVIKSRDFLEFLIHNQEVNEMDLSIHAKNFTDLHKIFNRDIVNFHKDKSSGYIRISVIHNDPFFAKELIEIIVSTINLLQKEKDFKNSSDALVYLNEQYSKKTLTNIRDSINSLVEEQLQIQMLSNIRQDYVFSYIDKPYVPQKKHSPIRSIYVILGLFLGFTLCLIYIFIKEFIKK